MSHTSNKFFELLYKQIDQVKEVAEKENNLDSFIDYLKITLNQLEMYADYKKSQKKKFQIWSPGLVARDENTTYLRLIVQGDDIDLVAVDLAGLRVKGGNIMYLDHKNGKFITCDAVEKNLGFKLDELGRVVVK